MIPLVFLGGQYKETPLYTVILINYIHFYIINISSHLNLKFCYLILSLEDLIFSTFFEKVVKCENDIINVNPINFILYILA